MCLLTFFPEHVEPDYEALWAGTVYNPDGFGYAIVTRKGLKIGRGMNAEHVIEKFGRDRTLHPDGAALFHSRFGTGGVYSRFNCHPFHFAGDRRTVVAHNGVLPTSVQPGKKDRRCDTRIAAEELLPSGFGHLSVPSNRDRVAAWIGKRNKLVILTVNPDYDRNHYIINESAGLWDHNIWYSNTDYRLVDLFDSKSLIDECPWCESAPAKFVNDKCMSCGRCVDCGQDWAKWCECYNYEPDNRDDAIDYVTREREYNALFSVD